MYHILILLTLKFYAIEMYIYVDIDTWEKLKAVYL